MGQESLDTPSWPICSLPTLHPFRVSRSRSMRRPSVILLWPVTLTLGFTSCTSSSYNSSYIPNTEQSPTPGITWDPCCSPCPHGARRVTHCTWSAFIVHGQVQSTVCPCETGGKPPQGQLHSCGIFIKDTQNSPQAPGPPRKEGMFCGPCSQSTHTITLYSTLPIN